MRALHCSTWLALALAACAWLFAPAAQAGIDIDAVKELKLLSEGRAPPQRFGNAAFRLAVFSYEDPDGLGLGDALATLARHELLAASRVSSIGVLRYSGSLTPQPGDTLGYFDKVEMLGRAQEPTAALWGMVRKVDDQLVIETFLQLPASTRVPALQARLRLPATMGGDELTATAGADRLLLQRLQLPLQSADLLREAAARLGELRQAPRSDAALVASLPLGTVFYVRERRGDWVLMAVAGGASGWVPLRAHCPPPCAPLLDAAQFVSQLLAFIQKRAPVEALPSLSADARQFQAELAALRMLGEAAEPGAYGRALAPLQHWLPKADAPASEAPALGAGAANLRLVARLAVALRMASLGQPRPTGEAYQRIELSSETVRKAAYEAAEATVIDPRHTELLHNLHVLYRWLGDETRASLAARLLEQARAGSRQAW